MRALVLTVLVVFGYSDTAHALYYNPADFLVDDPYSLSGSAGIGGEVASVIACPTTFPFTCAYSQATAFPDDIGSGLVRIVPLGSQGDNTVVDPSIYIQADSSNSFHGAGGNERLIYYFDITNLEGRSITSTGPDTVTLSGSIDYTPFTRTSDGGLSGFASLTITDTSTGRVIYSQSNTGRISTPMLIDPYRIYSVELDANASCSTLYSTCEASAYVDPVLTLTATDALTSRIIYSPGLLPGDGSTTTTTVPEPASVALLGIGLVSAVARRSRDTYASKSTPR